MLSIKKGDEVRRLRLEAGLPSTIKVGRQLHMVEPLLSPKQVQARVNKMGQELAAHYAERGEVHVLTVLSGALPFAADLRRAMRGAGPELDVTSSEAKVSSYASGMRSSGMLQCRLSPSEENVRGKHVLVADDVLDSGLTLHWLSYYLGALKPASIEAAVALRKYTPARPEDLLGNLAVHAGFDIGPDFVIGYGLDLDEHYRDLRGVYRLVQQAAGPSA